MRNLRPLANFSRWIRLTVVALDVGSSATAAAPVRRSSHRRQLLVFASLSAVILLFVPIATAMAANDQWASAASGDFDDNTKWVDGSAPTASDTATFDVGGIYLVEFDTSPTIEDLFFNSGLTVTLGAKFGFAGVPTLSITSATGGQDMLVTGGTLMVGRSLNEGFNIDVGDQLNVRGGADMTIAEASVVTADRLSIASMTGGGDGTLTVQHAGSELNITGAGTHQIGNFEMGTLTYEDGATGNIAGTLSVGAGGIANFGSGPGRLEVLSGAQLTTANLAIGGGPDAFGTLMLDDAGTSLMQTGASTLTVGKAGGMLNADQVEISSGGVLHTGTGQITINRSGVIAIVGGTLNANGDVSIGGGALVRTSGAFNLASGKTLATTAPSTFINFASGGEHHINNATSWQLTDTQSNALFADLGIGDDGTGGTFVLGGTDSEVDFLVGSTLVVGHATTGVGRLEVNDSAEFKAVTGLTTINATGIIDIDGGTFSANGDVLVDGGRIDGDGLGLAPDTTTTVTNGGLIRNPGVHLVPTDATLRVINGGALDLGVLSTQGQGAQIVIEGQNTTASITSLTFAEVTGGALQITDQAAVQSDTILIASGDAGIAGGATLSASDIQIGFDDIAGQGIHGEMTVSGPGTLVAQSGPGALLTVGLSGVDVGTGTLNVLIGGSLDSTADVSLGASGTFNINGGVVSVGSFTDTSGQLNFIAGSLSYVGDLTVGNDPLFGMGDQTLNASQHLAVTGTTTVQGGSTLTLDGGSLSTGSLNLFGVFNHNTGTLALTGDDLAIAPGGLFGPTVILPFNKNIDVTNTVNIDAAGLVSLTGGQLTGGVINNAGGVHMTGVTSELGGGTVNNSGLIHGTGRVTATLVNQVGGQVRVDAGDHIHLAGATNTNAGELQLVGGAIEVDQMLTNQAGGVISGRGVLIAGGGLTNQAAGEMNFSGGFTDVRGLIENQASGTIRALGGAVVTFFGDVQQDGDVIVSDTSIAVFAADVTGVGGFPGPGPIEFRDGASFGNSPAVIQFGGDVRFTSTAHLTIELGGTAPGQFDALSLDGAATLAGLLDVALVGGFMPALADTFDIITAAGGVSGTFVTLPEELPALAAGLAWAIDYGENNVLLSVVAVGPAGDYNENGIVDAADYTVWRDRLGQGESLPNDDTAGVGPDDYIRWVDNFGQTLATGSTAAQFALGDSPAANNAVPEPSPLCFTAAALLGACALLRRQRGADNRFGRRSREVKWYCRRGADHAESCADHR